MRHQVFLLCTLLTTALMAGGCTSSSEITKSWKSPEYTAKPLKSLLVIAISNDAIARGTVEGDVMKELRAADIPVQMGIELFPPLLFKDKISKEEAKKRIVESGADAVLLISVLSNEEKETYVPGAMVYTPGPGTVVMYGYWTDSWNLAYTQGAYTSTREIVLQSNLYRTSDEALLWAARSTSTNPSSLSKFSRVYSSVLVGKMMSDGALVKGR